MKFKIPVGKKFETVESLKDFLYSQTDKNGECWNFDGANGSYGIVCIDGKSYRAHRLSYALEFGEFEMGSLILHKCDNPPCIRPSHLEVGDHSKNVQDCINRGRLRPRGVPYFRHKPIVGSQN